MNHTILGLILLIAAVGGVFYFRHKRVMLTNAKYLETLTIADLHQKLYDMQKIEGDMYRHYVELKEILRGDGSLISPVNDKECVCYKVEIFEHYQEYSRYKKSDGSYGYRWVKKKRRIQTLIDSVNLYLLDPDTEQKVFIDRDINIEFKHTDSITAYKQSPFIRKFRLTPVYNSRHRTDYFELKESILIDGQEIYLLADGYSDENGDLRLGKTTRKGSVSVLSDKSEEELIKSSALEANITLGASIICLIAGVYFLLSGFGVF